MYNPAITRNKKEGRKVAELHRTPCVRNFGKNKKKFRKLVAPPDPPEDEGMLRKNSCRLVEKSYGQLSITFELSVQRSTVQ